MSPQNVQVRARWNLRDLFFAEIVDFLKDPGKFQKLGGQYPQCLKPSRMDLSAGALAALGRQSTLNANNSHRRPFAVQAFSRGALLSARIRRHDGP